MEVPPWRHQRRIRFPGIPDWGKEATALENVPVSPFPGITRDWAWGGSDGDGVRVCVVDTGVDENHPRVGRLERSAAVAIENDRPPRVDEDVHQDLAGHGTACAGIIRSVASGAALSSVRVLTRDKFGPGEALLAGLSWAIEQDFDVVNLSLSTTLPSLEPALRELADRACFRRTILVVSAHNMPIRSYPWSFSSVLSVASHDEGDPMTYYFNTRPPVDYYARGVRVRVAWVGGTEKVSTGNSFAAPHVAGICALILGKHRWLTPSQLRSVLFLTASNVANSRGSAPEGDVERDDHQVGG